MKNAEVDALAERLAARKGISKTAAVRLALQNEWNRDRSEEDLVAVSVAFCRDLIARSPSYGPEAAYKAFIDSLHEDE